VREPAAARLLPGKMLVKKLNRVTRPGQLLAAHRAGRSAADDRNVCHLGIFLTASDSVAGSLNNIAEPAKRLGPVLQAILCDREDNHRKSSEEYSTEESRRQRRPGTLSDNIHTCTLEQAEHR
jgi:hypothetical protein